MENREAARAEALIEQNVQELRRLITEEMGYTPVQNVEELGLSPEELKKIEYAKPGREGVRYFKSQTADGGDVKVLVRALAGRYVAADIFSDAFPGGHGFNSDFLWDELKQVLEQAKGRSRQST
ncbi:hypothetical protein A3J89_02010 [Candidatus Curtissbacteria bacterium RIFOXYB12_FULL_40_6]|nr:MAG: hypothetical protein A3J89_02010 [Candidatus Curtissbacteria bacterium RIFOXYB12_FULL_40_6]